MKIVLSLMLALVCVVSPATATDSLEMVALAGRARAQMNIDANVGKKILDSLRTRLTTAESNPHLWAEYYKLIGIYYYRTSAYDSSLAYYAQAREIYGAQGNRLELAKIMVNTSMVYNRTGDFDQTISFALGALREFEAIDDKKGIGVSLNIVGQVYHQSGSYEKGKAYFKMYLANAIASADTVELASAYGNLGAAHHALHQYDSSLHFYRRSLRLHLAKKNAYGIGNAYQNMASTYKDQGLTDSAFHYYRNAHRYYTEVSNRSGLAETALNMGRVFSDRGDYAQALVYLRQAIDLSENTNELFIQQEALKSLSLVYEKVGDTAGSLAAYKQYDMISDSIFNIQKTKNIETLNARYETDKKEQEILLQQSMLASQEAELQRNYILLFASFLLLVAAIIIFALLRNRLRRKQLMLQQEHEISLREAFIHASLQSQESERRRFAQDLHDGMGQLISSLKMTVSDVRKDIPLNQRMELLSRSERILNEMHTEIRSIAFNMMPQTLIQFGIKAALEEMALRLNDSGGVRVEVKTFDIPERLSEIQEISLYRIVQEWTNNILKHAGATRVDVQLVGHENELSIVIEDDGMGFDVNAAEKGDGNGWKNIQSRLRLIQASLHVDSEQNRQGTTFMVTMPLEGHLQHNRLAKAESNTQ